MPNKAGILKTNKSLNHKDAFVKIASILLEPGVLDLIALLVPYTNLNPSTMKSIIKGLKLAKYESLMYKNINGFINTLKA